MDDELRALARRAAAGETEAEARLRFARRRAGAGPTAVIADVHANLAALRAVLADIEAQGAQRILCLGDLIVFGPDPAECVDLVLASCEVVIRGCAEDQLREAPASNNASYVAARAFNAERLGEQRLDRLRELPVRHEEPGRLFVHGSPRAPTREWLFHATATREDPVWRAAFHDSERLLLVGHNHDSGAVVEGEPARAAAELGQRLRVPADRKAIVSVGSVGQPRDRDPRACYVLLDGDEVEWRRVPYDVEATVAKLAGTPMPEHVGFRLRRGV